MRENTKFLLEKAGWRKSETCATFDCGWSRYAIRVEFGSEEVREWIEQAREFLDVVQTYLEKS